MKRHIIGILIVASLVGVGSMVYLRVNKGTENELTIKLDVKDASESTGTYEAPYNVSKELLEELVSKDEYIQNNYNIGENLTEEITNLDNREDYTLYKMFSLNGGRKEENSTSYFDAGIKAYDTFENPSYLSLSYGYDSEEDYSKIKESAKNIVKALFNDKIASELLDNDTDTISEVAPTKSNKYSLKISKTISSNNGKNILDVVIDFNKTDKGNYDISKYKVDDNMKQIYKAVEELNKENILDIAKGYSSLLGEYSDTRISSLVNMVSSRGDVKQDTSSLIVRTVFEDGSAVTGEFGAIQIYKNDNLDENIIDYKASLPFVKDKKETVEVAKQLISSLFGVDIDIKDSDIEKGKYVETLSTNKYDGDVPISITVLMEEDNYGTYGSIEVRSTSVE